MEGITLGQVVFGVLYYFILSPYLVVNQYNAVRILFEFH